MIGFYMPCGCEPDLSFCGWRHAVRYSKVRYWWRILSAAPRFYLTLLKMEAMERLCWWLSEMQPSLGMVLGEIDMADAVSLSRRWEEAADSWRQGRRRFLFLGADSEHPDGIFARSPRDLVCMTNDEAEHWS